MSKLFLLKTHSRGAQKALCALRDVEGLTTDFGQLKGAEQEKVGHPDRNRGNRSEKRDLKVDAYTRPARASKNDYHWSVGRHMGCKMTAIIGLVGTDHTFKVLRPLLFEILAKN